MLRITTSYDSRMCDGLSRRSFLHVGTLGLAGLSLPHLLSAGENPSYATNKSVILLFLGGGPSQLETWDPKPEGLDTSTSLAGHISTSLTGVRFASYFPKLARLADRLSVVRSFHTHHAEHNGAHKQILTADTTIPDGKPIKHPGMGAVVARVLGASDPTTGMPRQAVIPPTTRHTADKAGFAGAYDSVLEGCQPAYLGASFSPFELKVPMSEGQPRTKKKKGKDVEPSNPALENLTPQLDGSRLTNRRELLTQLDRIHRGIDVSGVMESADAQTARAWEVLRSGQVRNALDLSQEEPRVLAAYDTEHYRNYRVNDNSFFERNGPSIGISLGRQLLMARRLCEAGCGFVTVIHANWDFHARKGIPNMPEGMSVLAPPLDHAVAAFLEDVRQRGLEDEILLVITGEFGRTPKLDDNLGRHHWPGICPLVFAGGDLNHGQVIGRSDRRGGKPADDPYSIDDLHATIMHTLFDIGKMRLDPALPNIVMQRATRGTPIQGLR